LNHSKFSRNVYQKEVSVSRLFYPPIVAYYRVDTEACVGVQRQPIYDLKTKLHFGLSQRMKNYENKKYLRISTLLDPRFKNHANIFITAAERNENEAILEGELLDHTDFGHQSLERRISNPNKKVAGN
jgi:hypothetical protein